ncbi:exodeoxyribonuclease I [Pseudomonas typographi]|uniref:Exodeoxyribonuclease I n=1 Tax=Pseudomonas typographi TaxID=2715964 RepID=A0ABR7YXB6_9PSED|nr:exodeoxyribonuclease I [Pseudomonas typographi]MBD1585750.1 exodeoxyribonuclease I [Pseudomonas typographi]MBD1597824.1 exodeoxyribonuclease I [Pseudomonas typographi]
MTTSLFWYDFETTGINPRCDRPLQMAGLRTDAEFNEIDAPVNLYCRLSDDVLPHPAACLITGITPQVLESQGMKECEFMGRVHAELSRPGTCALGYNTLRFDDEVTRYSLYRNFYDPYGREWQGGNSRWDLIDVVRTAYALRPQGIEWPLRDGQPSLKLEALTAANGLEHGKAHDALSDVHATIALARLVKQRQPRLFDWLFALRSKHKVLEQIRLMQPLVHVSGRFSAARSYLGVVLPLAWHPRNRNALIVCDLQLDPSVLWREPASVLARRLYTRRDALAEGELPVPLKLVQINRCPVLAPMSVLREADIERLGLDMPLLRSRANELEQTQGQWNETLREIYAGEEFAPHEDPEQQLYNGFISERDRRLCEQVRAACATQLRGEAWIFDDPRLPELLFRYRARNFPESLSAEEQARWLAFCQGRLTQPAWGAPNTLEAFETALAECLPQASGPGQAVLVQWQRYAGELAARLGITAGGPPQ